MKQKEMRTVKDYWKFTRELKSQLNLVSLLERQFFGLDELCEWAISNDVSVLKPETGERVSVVDDDLSARQADVYDRLRIEVENLYDLLKAGRSCFEMRNGKGDYEEGI